MCVNQFREKSQMITNFLKPAVLPRTTPYFAIIHHSGNQEKKTEKNPGALDVLSYISGKGHIEFGG